MVYLRSGNQQPSLRICEGEDGTVPGTGLYCYTGDSTEFAAIIRANEHLRKRQQLPQ